MSTKRLGQSQATRPIASTSTMAANASTNRKRALAKIQGAACVSQRGLGRILKIVEEVGLHDAPSRGELGRSIRAIGDYDTPCGGLLQKLVLRKTSGGTFDWWPVHPGAALTFHCEQSEAFSEFFQMFFASRPSTPRDPWTLVVYFDECTTGNLLSLDPARKSWLVWWSVLEWGPERLAREDCWVLGGVLRSKVCAQLESGWSGVMRAYFETMWFGEGSNFHDTGFMVRGHGGQYIGLVFGRFGFIVADMDAFRSFWKTMGASGNLMCMFCQNTVRRATGLATQATRRGLLVDHAETRPDKFILHTDASMYATCDRLRDIPPRDVPGMETASGVHLDLGSMMFSHILRHQIRPISNTMLDFGHIFVICGMFQFEMTLLLPAVKEALGIRFVHFKQYMETWSAPAWMNSVAASVFSPARERRDEFSSGSSEASQVYPWSGHSWNAQCQATFWDLKHNRSTRCVMFWMAGKTIKLKIFARRRSTLHAGAAQL